MSKYLIICLIFLLSLPLFADELALVTTISSSRKRFIVNLGTTHGIVPDQVRAFSTDNISLMCYAVETGPNHSLWQVHEKNAQVPFYKGQVLLIHTNLMDDRTRRHLYVEKERLDKLRKSGDLLFEDFDYESKQMGLFRLAKRPTWVIRGGLGVTAYNSLSSADADQKSDKSQINLEGLYTTKIFSHRFDFGIGFRWDQEAEIIKENDLTIPSRRFMLISELNYHLDKWSGSLNNFYFGAGVGIGKTSSSVDEFNLSGTSYLFPYLKLGILNHIQKKLYIIAEASIENLITNMKVEETGEKQSSSNINTKLSIGIRF